MPKCSKDLRALMPGVHMIAAIVTIAQGSLAGHQQQAKRSLAFNNVCMFLLIHATIAAIAKIEHFLTQR